MKEPPPLPDDMLAIAATYDERGRKAEEDQRAARRVANLVSHGRLIAFLGAVALVVWGMWEPTAITAGPFLLAGLALVLFVALVLLHRRIFAKVVRLGALHDVNVEAVARLARRWGDVPVPWALRGDEPNEAADLDLLGRASIVHLAGAPSTARGRALLEGWLLGGADAGTIRRRQAALGELSGRLDLRQELQVLGRALAEAPPDLGGFFQWAEGGGWLSSRRWLRVLAVVLGVVNVTLVVLDVTDVVPLPFWILSSLVALGLTFTVGVKIHQIFGAVSAGERAVGRYAAIFEYLGTVSFTDPTLAALHGRLVGDAGSAAKEMRRLALIMSLADLRYSAMIYFPVQTLTMWDVHVMGALEAWQRRAGRHVRGWFEALGELEALSCLASLAHDHPQWSYPTIREPDEEPRLTAEGLTHPLIHPAEAVANDVTVGPPGTFLLVTGSNMSGKSTLLRAVGINVALALAGAPVAARSMDLSTVTLGTSFRIRDSIEEGVSYFMAELRRLKEVVDRAGKDTTRRLVYLFDEILLGTNVVERQIAVQHVLAHLVEAGAIGAIATHDLTLAEASGLAAAARPVYFTESFSRNAEGEPAMSFDYVLREGVAPTTNALALLEMVGLSGRAGAR